MDASTKMVKWHVENELNAKETNQNGKLIAMIECCITDGTIGDF